MGVAEYTGRDEVKRRRRQSKKSKWRRERRMINRAVSCKPRICRRSARNGWGGALNTTGQARGGGGGKGYFECDLGHGD